MMTQAKRSLTSLARKAAAVLGCGLMLSGCGGGGGGGGDMVSIAGLEVYGDQPHPRQFQIHGIDVSKYQGDIDWRTVADSNVQFAWIKATEGGDHVDSKFFQNWQAAKAAGLPRGAYHFVYWCRTPQQEMAWFEANVPVEPDALPPVLDVEATPESRTCKRHLEPGQAQAEMRVMLQEMERHFGKRPMIYTTVDFYQAILADGALSDYPIWVRSTKYHPSVKYNRPWHFWQYQSDGSVPGIRGKVDRNAFYGSPKDWKAFMAGDIPPAVNVQQAQR